MPAEYADGHEPAAHHRASEAGRRRTQPDSEEPTLPVAAVARRLGVAPATLRTWDRRYGLGPSGHTGGKHRRYSPGDIARLEAMQRALLSGASTAEAARYALEAGDAARPPHEPGESAEPAARAPAGAGKQEQAAADDARARERRSRHARRLSAATLAMDPRAVRRLVEDAVAADGPLSTFDEVIAPVLAAITQGWGRQRPGIESEHVLTECALGALVRATPRVERPSNHHPVLLVAMRDDRRNLALYALAAGLALRGVDALVFNATLPSDALVAAARRCAPSAIVLWAYHASAAEPVLARRLSRSKQRGRVFVWGSGWDVSALPASVEPLGSVTEAADRISYVLAGVVTPG
ncbi:MerR family transcriptional regulator [Haloechinothrix sp. LS1_15]|uniref:MerR family transcriptional regulator n=1 Tax=Haloechinothrix sp. LS1_15 TaxID=2652248 RepID=UPI00294859DD|nr:MerR family transcriptional regulator [Haloechinothrix sp. LS1_15]MDV6013063.1 MerR family transcriptional regulator [Haloechinothrix sp. LS1_15]